MTYPEHPPTRPAQPPVPLGGVPSSPGMPHGPAGFPPVQGPTPYPPVGQGYPPAGPPSWAAPRPRNGMATASLVLGIIGVLAVLGSSGERLTFADSAELVGNRLVPITLGVLAVVFGAQGRQRAARGESNASGRATAGMVMGIVTLVVASLVMVLWLIV